MSPRKRNLLVTAGTLSLFALGLVSIGIRLHTCHERGWTGVYYVQPTPPSEGPGPYGQKPGQILTMYSGSPMTGILRGSDVIVAVNGIPIRDLDRLHRLDDSLHRGDTVVYRVERVGGEVDVRARLASPLASWFIVAKVVVALIVSSIFMVVALLVILRRPGDRRAQVFYVFALFSAMAILGGAATVYETSGGRGIIPSAGFGSLSLLLTLVLSLAYLPLILHLALIFPRERPIVMRSPNIVHWIYAGAVFTGAPLLGILVLIVNFWRSSMEAGAEEVMTHSLGVASLAVAIAGLLVALQVAFAGRREPLIRAFARRPYRAAASILGFFVAAIWVIGHFGSKLVAVIAGFGGVFLMLGFLVSYPILATVALVRSYRAASVEEKRQVQWPLWGLVIALSCKVLINATGFAAGVGLQLTHTSMLPWQGFFEVGNLIPTIASVLIPLSFAAAILKYRLMNIDVLIRKTVVYGILSGAIIVVYLVLVGGLGSLLITFVGLRNQTMVIASTLVVALLFVPIRNRLQTLVDRNLFRHRYDYPEALRIISVETHTATDAPTFLGSVAEKLQQALQSRNLVIFAERQDDYVATAKVGVSDTLLGHLRVARSFQEMLARPFDPRKRTLPEDAAGALGRIEAALVVPIGVRGFITVGPKLSGGDLDVEDIDFLRSASDQIMVAIDRIRMQLEEVDFAQARTIQESLLPGTMPRVERLEVSGIWQPARTMGGDYYDLIELGERELAICIGDVAGKGMPAALLMSGLQAAVRASASSSPRDLCERVRRVVVSSLSGGRFVTFFYATIDTSAMRLRWCNAGHNAPILGRADGSIVRLAEGGPAFSRLFRDAYEEHELALAPGDRVVLFTDGVSEPTDAAGELFGEERIEQIVASTPAASALALQQQIVDAATAHSGGELEDDLTLVVVGVGD